MEKYEYKRKFIKDEKIRINNRRKNLKIKPSINKN